MKEKPILVVPCLGDPKLPNPMYHVDQQKPLMNGKGHPFEEKELEDMMLNDIKTKCSSFNMNTIRVGSRDFTQGITKRVINAYAMYTNPKTRPDIAIIITEKPIDRSGQYPETHIGPICLPTRYH